MLKAHAKKASAKLAPRSNKSRYISKAEREKLAAQTVSEPSADTEQGFH
ncbi:DUF2986 domain-containing protein [Pseudomonas sp.]|nr:DUF2986 domain-containing protein [Pseudomonas sp.]MBO9549318.1 DUF2986 domain-containing protein [Pseudomonas sp.]